MDLGAAMVNRRHPRVYLLCLPRRAAPVLRRGHVSPGHVCPGGRLDLVHHGSERRHNVWWPRRLRLRRGVGQLLSDALAHLALGIPLRGREHQAATREEEEGRGVGGHGFPTATGHACVFAIRSAFVTVDGQQVIASRNTFSVFRKTEKVYLFEKSIYPTILR